MASGDKFSKGEKVTVKVYGDQAREGVVVDKTRGDTTVVRIDGQDELFANKAITRKR
jgi:hypothetical protein